MIQELVLVLDGRNGLGLAFFLFGASVFWVPAGHPKWVPKRPLRPPVKAAGEDFLPSKKGVVRGAKTGPQGPKKTGRNRPRVTRQVKRWGVDCMTWKARIGSQEMPERQTGFTG